VTLYEYGIEWEVWGGIDCGLMALLEWIEMDFVGVGGVVVISIADIQIGV